MAGDGPRPWRRAVAVAVVVALAAVGAWAATRLWRTSVPADLPAPPVDLERTFGAQALREAEHFAAFPRVTALLSQVVVLVTLALYAFRGARFARESAAGPIGTGFLLGMLGLAIVWLVQLPFRVADVWWLRRHDVIEVGYVEAIVGDLAALAGTFLYVCLALLVAMGLARTVRGRWWLPAGVAFVALFAGLTFVSPYLYPGLTSADAELRGEAVRLAEREGLDGELRVQIEEVRDHMSQPNAFAMGLGPTRRIVLYDTLAYDFPGDQVRATLAHEVAHHARDHLAKGIGWFALVIVPTALVVALVTRRRGGLGVPEAVPLALLVVVALNLVTGPLQNAASRRYEAEADWSALNATRDPEAVEGLWRSFTERALADPDPPGWWQLLNGSHPTGVERVQMARAWGSCTASDGRSGGAAQADADLAQRRWDGEALPAARVERVDGAVVAQHDPRARLVGGRQPRVRERPGGLGVALAGLAQPGDGGVDRLVPDAARQQLGDDRRLADVLDAVDTRVAVRLRRADQPAPRPLADGRAGDADELADVAGQQLPVRTRAHAHMMRPAGAARDGDRA